MRQWLLLTTLRLPAAADVGAGFLAVAEGEKAHQMLGMASTEVQEAEVEEAAGMLPSRDAPEEV